MAAWIDRGGTSSWDELPAAAGASLETVGPLTFPEACGLNASKHPIGQHQAGCQNPFEMIVRNVIERVHR